MLRIELLSARVTEEIDEHDEFVLNTFVFTQTQSDLLYLIPKKGNYFTLNFIKLLYFKCI